MSLLLSALPLLLALHLFATGAFVWFGWRVHQLGSSLAAEDAVASWRFALRFGVWLLPLQPWHGLVQETAGQGFVEAPPLRVLRGGLVLLLLGLAVQWARRVGRCPIPGGSPRRNLGVQVGHCGGTVPRRGWDEPGPWRGHRRLGVHGLTGGLSGNPGEVVAHHGPCASAEVRMHGLKTDGSALRLQDGTGRADFILGHVVSSWSC
jgi:hypothetical protein